MARATIALVFAHAMACGGSPPRATTLELNARTHGSTLELQIRNTGSRQVVVPIDASGDDDRLMVGLSRTGQPRLEYAFREPSVHRIAIEPGATHTESIDLVSAALHDNAEPPPPGDYVLGAAWSEGGQRLAATTKLTIGAPSERPCTSAPARTGIELLARQLATGVVEIGLHNTLDTSICIATRIDAGFPQSDWLAIELADARDGARRAFHFVALRHAAVRVTAELPPGATAWSRWDLTEWATRLALPPLAPGLYSATATYDSVRETTVFHGAVTTHFVVTVR